MAVESFYTINVVEKYHSGNYIRFKQELLQYLYLSRIPNKKEFIILDIGAGGGLSFYIRNKLGLKNPIWAVEPTKEMFNHLIRNVSRIKGDNIISMNGSDIPVHLYKKASLITLISVGGAVKRIYKKWETKWFEILNNTFSLLLTGLNKELFLQVYDKTVAKRVLNYSKAFNLQLNSINNKEINELKTAETKISINYLKKVYEKINSIKLSDDELRNIFNNDDHFKNKKLFLGYCFLIKPKRIIKNIVNEKIIIINKTLIKLINKELSIKQEIDTLTNLRKSYTKKETNYKEVINYLLKKNKKIKNSLLDLWLFHPLEDNKDLKNRLKIKEELMKWRSKNTFNNKIDGYLIKIIKFYEQYT